ncbi:hypothetical protein HYW43_01685 [Candidatus Daviesbacteria bacterium]|nr:hypothetical protein [Candidatus Daviesbacteria bacterium]
MPDQEPKLGQTPENLSPQTPEEGARATLRAVANRLNQLGFQFSPLQGRPLNQVLEQDYQRAQRGIEELFRFASELSTQAASGQVEFEKDESINKAVVKLPPRSIPPKQP